MEETIGEHLSSIDNNIRSTFDRGTSFELSECENSINSNLRNLEYILNGYRVASPAQIDGMVQQLKRGLGKVKTLISNCRDEEKRYTIDNLQRVGLEIDEAINGLEEFETEGIRPTGQDDIYYKEDVKKQINAETKEFIETNGITNPRVADEILEEMEKLNSRLSGNHDRVSANMKYTIKEKVHEIGNELINQKNEGEKADSFTSSLQSQTVSKTDLARSDAEALSDNESAFIGNEEPKVDTRKTLEDMFK